MDLLSMTGPSDSRGGYNRAATWEAISVFEQLQRGSFNCRQPLTH
jgi:hypothetical protein